MIPPTPLAQDLPRLRRCLKPSVPRTQLASGPGTGAALPWPRAPARLRKQSRIGAVTVFRKLQLFCTKAFSFLAKQ